jgi:hypothetical protein
VIVAVVDVVDEAIEEITGGVVSGAAVVIKEVSVEVE